MLTSARVKDGGASTCKEEGDLRCHSIGKSILGRQDRLPMECVSSTDCIHARHLE